MKSKFEHKRSKGVDSKHLEKEPGFEEIFKELEKSQQLPVELVKMCSELGLGAPGDDCPGNCIICNKKVSCETYKKIRDCFTG